jgi:AcrR family transcriptional regulator
VSTEPIGTRERKRGEQRDRILESARALFREHGAEAITMAEIAEEAEVSRATVFNHFGSKQALIEAIAETVLEIQHQLIAEAIDDRKTPTTELIRLLFHELGSVIETERRFHRGFFHEIARLSLGLDADGPSRRSRQADVQLLIQLFTRGQARGELLPGHRPEDLATAFDGLVFGTITHWLHDGATESLRARMERAAEILLAPVAVDSSPPKQRRPTRKAARRVAATPTSRRRRATPPGRGGRRRR